MPNIPGVNFSYPTGGLAVGSQEDIRNESVLIIGTAEDGPTDTVIRMRSPAFMRSVYGRSTIGDLVRKAEECWYAQTGKQDIRALRVSNGRKAKLALAESSGYNLAKEQPTGTSLTGQTILTTPAMALEMRYPGSVYNQATLRTGVGPTGMQSVIFYNPKSGLDSYYSFNADPNAYADVHNIRDLAVAMNSDPNFTSIASAEATALEAHGEMVIDPQGNDGLALIAGPLYADEGYAMWLWGYNKVDEIAQLGGEDITATPGTSGHMASAANYYYIVSKVNENGEAPGPVTTPTRTDMTYVPEASGAVTGPNGSVSFTLPVIVAPVLGYRIYRSTTNSTDPEDYTLCTNSTYPTGLITVGGAACFVDIDATPQGVKHPPLYNTTKYWGGYGPDVYGGTSYDNHGKLGVSIVDNKVRLDLSTRLYVLDNENGAPVLTPSGSYATQGGSYGAGVFTHTGGTAAYLSQTAGNRVAALTKIGELAGTAVQIIDAAGFSRMDLPYAPIVPPPVRWDNAGTITTTALTSKLRPIRRSEAAGVFTYNYASILGRIDQDTWSIKDYPDAVQIVTHGFVGVVPVLPSNATSLTLEFAAHLPPDAGDGAGHAGASTRALDPSRWDAAYLIDEYGDVAYTTGDNTMTVYEVYSNGSFVDCEGDLGRVWTVTWEAPVGGGEPKASITFTGATRNELPPNGASIYVTYKSLPGKLTQTNNLMGTHNLTGWDAWKTYFLTGRRIYFGGALPTPIQIAYAYEKVWNVNSDVTILDYMDGVLEWTDRSNQPGTYSNDVPPIVVRPATSTALPAPDWTTAVPQGDNDAQWARLVLYYDYDPEWIDLGTTARAFQGGSDGANMTAADLYDAMTAAYDLLANYRCDHMILPDGAYLDATKLEPNPVTGIFEEVNAGFQSQLGTALDTMLENVHETMAYMTVTPPADNRLSTVSNWVQKLTVIDPSDTTRGANWMSILDHRLIHVLALQSVVTNPTSVRYISDGIASFVGTYAELPLDEGLTMHRIPSWIGLRFELSPGQLEAMTSMRYITARTDPHTGSTVVTDVPSAAAAGSDYARSTTTRIVRRVCDDVRTVVAPFLGKLSEDSIYNAAATAISNVLRSHMGVGSLRQGSTFSVYASPSDRVRGVMNVRLTLAVNFEIRIINVVVNLIAR